MNTRIIDGKAVSEQIQQELATEIKHWKTQLPRAPQLAVILVGEDAPSQIYVRHKQKACLNVGIESQTFNLPEQTSADTLKELIFRLNADETIDGILVQLPLPARLKPQEILECIDLHKDVDGFHPYNVGKLALRDPAIRPCTPYGVITLLERLSFNIKGLHAVVVGSSNVVGRPMALELLLAGCTVTICHRFTKELSLHTQRADLLVSAVGKPHLINAHDVKAGVIAIDVGMTRNADGKLVGDLDYAGIFPKASAITPVPGGVGPMTVTMLLKNTVSLYLQHLKIRN